MKRFWSRLSLNKKVITIIVLTGIATTTTIIPAIFFTISDVMQSQQQDQLTGIKNLVEDLLEDNHRAIRNYAVLFSENREVRDNLFYHTVLEGERTHPLNAIKHLVDAFDVRFIELCDRNGRVVANTEHPEMYDVNGLSTGLIKTALSGKLATGIERQQRGFILIAVSPVYYNQGQTIGTITTGTIMDDVFLERLKLLSGVELAITDNNDAIVASTLLPMREKEKLYTHSKTLNVENVRYLLKKTNLLNSYGMPLGNVLIMTKDKLPQIMRNVQFMMISLLSLIAVVSITATSFILRKVISPIHRLKDVAEKIGSGDFNQKIKIISEDEIGSLAEVFNQMAVNLQNMREIEERLKHAEKLASIGKFTAGIAHEINNPVANIIGLAKIIRKNIPGNFPFTEELDIVINEAIRCGAIVRDLLLYSRQSPPKKETVDINSLVEGILYSVHRSTDGKIITLRKDFDLSLPPVYADKFQIEQVMRNIFLNAVQSIKHRGEITVKTARKENSFIEISISDTGCGINEEDLDMVFYPFYTSKMTGEGTGLGLTVSYGIIQSHGGDINIESKINEGSTFRITLPIEGKYEQAN